jgi:hypothetical protein
LDGGWLVREVLVVVVLAVRTLKHGDHISASTLHDLRETIIEQTLWSLLGSTRLEVASICS